MELSTLIYMLSTLLNLFLAYDPSSGKAIQDKLVATVMGTVYARRGLVYNLCVFGFLIETV